jgi:hypothetical protein
MKTRTVSRNFHINRMAKRSLIQGRHQPAFRRLPLPYGDYTKKSFEDTKAFVEKLSGVRSLHKAIEVQTEFAKTAYETFVTESQKIGALYGDLARQSCKPFGGLVAKMTPTDQ